MVMPYTSATGASGVANLAAAYGVPIVCSDIPDFREMGDSGGLAIKFYPVGNKAALAQNMLDLAAATSRSSMRWRSRIFPRPCA